jgi:hypothetical protein
VRLTVEEAEAFTKAADARGLSLPEYLRHAANRVAAENAERDQMAGALADMTHERNDARAGRAALVEAARALADEWGTLDLASLGTLSRPTTEALVHKMADNLRATLDDR